MCDYIDGIGSLKVVYKTLHKTVVDPVLQIREGSHPDPETRGRGAGGGAPRPGPSPGSATTRASETFLFNGCARTPTDHREICNHSCNHVLEKRTQSSEQEPRKGFI